MTNLLKVRNKTAAECFHSAAALSTTLCTARGNLLIDVNMVSKIIVSIFVVILNYILSKIFIFRSKDKSTNHN